MPLRIAGIVQDQDYFDRAVAPHLDGERVRYIGPVGPDERAPCWAARDALLHLISFEEPFGFSVIEAMACGTPVIANRRGSMPELVRDGENGYLVDSVEDAVEAVDLSRHLDRTAVRASVVDRFSASRMVDEYLALYRRVVTASRTGEP